MLSSLRGELEECISQSDCLAALSSLEPICMTTSSAAKINFDEKLYNEITFRNVSMDSINAIIMLYI